MRKNEAFALARELANGTCADFAAGSVVEESEMTPSSVAYANYGSVPYYSVVRGDGSELAGFFPAPALVADPPGEDPDEVLSDVWVVVECYDSPEVFTCQNEKWYWLSPTVRVPTNFVS